MKYYVYQYVREDNTPYYIGKGNKARAWAPHKRINNANLVPTDRSRIQILAENLSEEEAIKLEIALISKLGRKDLGTGILRNMTDGGDGSSGRIYNHSIETKLKISVALKGKSKPARTVEHKQKLSIAASKPRMPHTAETKEKLKKPKPRGTCPCCGKEGGINAMKRYHFENCKDLTKT